MRRFECKSKILNPFLTLLEPSSEGVLDVEGARDVILGHFGLISSPNSKILKVEIFGKNLIFCTLCDETKARFALIDFVPDCNAL